ncbi:hypothetical protein BH23GEM2_BH23GEM2_08210 [soil metagenome]
MTDVRASAGSTPRIGEWLLARTPPGPVQLAVRMQSEMAHRAHGGAPVNEELEQLAVQRLGDLIARGNHSREVAAELLAVDALVTYACEAAVERWEHGELSEEALRRWCEQFATRIAGVAGSSS